MFAVCCACTVLLLGLASTVVHLMILIVLLLVWFGRLSSSRAPLALLDRVGGGRGGDPRDGDGHRVRFLQTRLPDRQRGLERRLVFIT